MDFNYDAKYGAELDVDLGRLTDWLPQLDAVLSGPIFNDLTNVVVGVGTRGGLYVRDETFAYGFRLCLPTLAARGILGCVPLHLVHSAVSITVGILIAYS